jgi:nucleoside phosphorylase
VLVVEDEAEKREAVQAEIRAFFEDGVEIEGCATFGQAARRLAASQFDLVVTDLMLPRLEGQEPTDVSEELIEHFAESELNRAATIVAVSRFEEVVARRHGSFTRAGILLIGYSEDDAWRSCLRVCMQRVASRTIYDFVVVCALELERSAFEAVIRDDFSMGAYVGLAGLNGREMSLGGLHGVCVLQPQMGLVDASIVASRALSVFTPRLVCMTGVCGGFEDQAPIGTLVVSDFTWEHQAGKQIPGGFEIRSYMESVGNDTRVVLSQLIEEDQSLARLQSRSYEIQVPLVGAMLAPTVSGSAVIASQAYAADIAKQHGKVAAVDMEVFGVFRAAALHGSPVRVFAAKTVVDHADEAKGSTPQQPGAILSARFAVEAIRRLLPEV